MKRIQDDKDLNLMMTAAMRYCLTRSSYIVGAGTEFMERHFNEFDRGTRTIMIRDAINEIVSNGFGYSCDLESWERFVMRCWAKLKKDEKESLRHSFSSGFKLSEFINALWAKHGNIKEFGDDYEEAIKKQAKKVKDGAK